MQSTSCYQAYHGLAPVRGWFAQDEPKNKEDRLFRPPYSSLCFSQRTRSIFF